MKSKHGVAFKLALITTLCVLGIFAILFAYNYKVSKSMIYASTEQNARYLALAVTKEIESLLSTVGKVSENIAYSLEESPMEKEKIIDLTGQIVKKNEEILGVAIAFEPFKQEPDKLYFAPYSFRYDNKIKFTFPGSESYRYFYEDWYQLPKELSRPVWTEPYFDKEGARLPVITYSVPFFREIDGAKKFFGVVAANISLNKLTDLVSSHTIFESGFVFVLSRGGTFLSHTDNKLIMNESIFTMAEAEESTELRSIGKKMLRGDSGFIPTKCHNRESDCFLYYAPLPSSGWSVGVMFPKKEFMADITQLNRKMLLIGILGVFFLVAAVVFISNSIIKPIRLLSASAGEIASGNLDTTLPEIKSGDEIGELTESFKHMTLSLKEYIKDLTDTTAAKERIESELSIARDIQMGILPKIFPPFPLRSEFDISAIMEPAREVGGDFYDFFFMDQQHLFFIIADVSGKGVPASLYMAITRTLIRAKVGKILKTGEILRRVNEDLSHDNDSGMFVTVFCGILNTDTGLVTYSNGGHNPPFLYNKKNDTIHALESEGIALGVIEDDYIIEEESITMGSGDLLVMYTDGVTEAFNEDEEEFGEERLKSLIKKHNSESVGALLQLLHQEITAFSGNREQHDDITMLTIKIT